MQKRLIIFSIIFVIILNLFGICNTVNADTANIEINLDGNKTIKQDATTVELTLSLGNFVGVEESTVLAASFDVEYDDSMFSKVDIEGQNGWSAHGQGTKYTLETDSAKSNTVIAKITLTLKEGLEPETSGTFKLNNFNLGDDGDVDITVNKSATITIEKAAETGEPAGGTTTQDPDPTPTPEQKADEYQDLGKTPTQTQTQQSKQPDQKKAVTTLPYSGISNFIVITFLIVLGIGIFALIRYKTIKIK